MQDRPDPIDLVRTVAQTLREKLMPQLSGSSAFEARVAANALDLVARQLERADASHATEMQRLESLLDRTGTLEDLNRELCARITDGRLAADDPGLKQHLWATTLDKLAVDQPTYAAYLAENNKQ
ncbi:DUF6285 domain-containing protein [Bradyrhizobium prioriisuperbiae]|uniref:DUF6285 domain-containing protein n=1 Tax=Bradyrhizobium prioriisuperbiae TaxID=2854389 RepID=UPI0028F0940A|nr:DUF6285 domain-containing protein [Bradyrhizobium prioritasuperba]